MSDPTLKGNGAAEVAVKGEGNMVVVLFDQPAAWLLLEPQDAFALAERVARIAHEVRFGEAPQTDGSYLAQQVRSRLTEELRDRMITRATIMLRSMREQHRADEYMAAQVVDTIFAEVQ